MASEDKGEAVESPAIALINRKVSEGILTAQEGNHYKLKYQQLHDYLLRTYDTEKALLKRAKVLNQDLLAEKIKLEKFSIRRHEGVQSLASLEKERERVSKELAECIEEDAMLQYSVAEVEREYDESVEELTEMQNENARLVEPEIAQLEEICEQLSNELDQVNEASAKEEANQTRLHETQASLHKSMAVLGEKTQQEKQTLSKLKADPGRIKKQSDVVEKAVENMASDVERVCESIRVCDHELQQQITKKKELSESNKDLSRKLELHRSTIEQRERELESVQKALELECGIHNDLLTRRVELDLQTNEVKSRIREGVEEQSRTSKLFEAEKKKLKKRVQQVDSLKATLPQLKNQLNDAEHLATSYKFENKQLQQSLHSLQQEVDILIANYLRQENCEKNKRDILEKQRLIVKELEKQISLWVQEEGKQNKQLSLLSAQREIKAREASRALQHERETKEDLRVKELIMVDLTKKCNELNNRLREFSALYDVVKNERNKYVNLIQASSQALAEMKEKIKILHNEVEILRNESLAKDRALAKERLAHQTAQCQRDSARLETNKSNSVYRAKQQIVEQQIVQIDKLNSVINVMEKKMLKLKKQYELSVENRNYTGVHLVDRNDELCILYEKSNLQAQTLRNGELRIRECDEEIRMIKLQVAEATHKMQIARTRIPKMPALAKKILELKRLLHSERVLSDKLCKQLETPENMERWRPLKGDDPDVEQLSAKIQVLEDRLNEKKEQALEKELVLEEVTALANKMKDKAKEGKEATFQLARRVNCFQTKIKEKNKKMMATVSELSMYQATSIKLEQEKQDREQELHEAEERLSRGEAPTHEIHKQWEKALHTKRLMVAHRNDSIGMQDSSTLGSTVGMPGTSTGKGENLLRTTAQPRPNAYIPDEIGIPRPYGNMAPFKPVEAGAIMRHYRQPRIAPIEI